MGRKESNDHHRNLQRRDPETIVAISDTYLPFWFAEMLPELEKPESYFLRIYRKWYGRSSSNDTGL